MENSTINKREWVLWGIAIASIMFSSFAVWQMYLLKLDMIVINTRTERAEKEFNLREQTAVNFSAQYPISGMITKIEKNQWTVEVKIAQAPSKPSIFSKVGEEKPVEIKYDTKQSIISFSDTVSFLGKKKEEFVVGDKITAYAMEPIMDITKVSAMRVETQGFKPGIVEPVEQDDLSGTLLPQ
ncbi:MAG TPA: hypothetical protein DCS23_02800 [Candidatus Yonathbacteria bacterium]|nr:hypothetical protein [Candidatus Yonathbacteria bacterium]